MSNTLVIEWYPRRIETRADDFSSSDVATTDEGHAWFYTPEWQARYQLAIIELNSGNYAEFDNGDDFLASLNDL